MLICKRRDFPKIIIKINVNCNEALYKYGVRANYQTWCDKIRCLTLIKNLIKIWYDSLARQANKLTSYFAVLTQ